MENRLKINAQRLGIELSDRMLEQFDSYFRMLTEKNKVMNLTAITEYSDVVDKHFIDSLSIVKCLDMSGIDTVMDVGTGAGFPGIPLKIAFPHIRLTLLDSLNKRVGFLNEVISELMFDNTKAVHSRAEDGAHDPALRQGYTLVVSRAVADLSVLAEYCLPYARKGGCFIAYKSANSEEEIRKAAKAVAILGGANCEECSFLLPGSDLPRTLVKIDKVKDTPRKYPRKAGTPSKCPLK